MKTTVSILTALIMLGGLGHLWIRPIRRAYRDLLNDKPGYVFLMPTILCLMYVGYCAGTGGVEIIAVRMLVYLFVPVCLLYLAEIFRTRNQLWDMLALASIIIPYDSFWLGKRIHHHGLDWSVLTVSATIETIVLFACLRTLPNTRLRIPTYGKDFVMTAVSIVLLSGIGLVLGVKVGLLKAPEPNLAAALARLCSLKFLGAAFGFTLTVAMSEEIWFRGIIQNYLIQRTGKYWGIIFASVLFGIYHFNNKGGSWIPSQWNWRYGLVAAVVGMGYGIIAHRTRSLAWPMIVHGLLDAAVYAALS